jgi:transposase-like protein
MQTLFAHRSLHEKIKEFYGFFSEHIEDRARQKTEELVEEALRAEMDMVVGAERYQRSDKRQAYRNGHGAWLFDPLNTRGFKRKHGRSL